MFQNSVLKANVNTKAWFKSALIRAVKTMAQVAAAGIPVGAAIGGVDWAVVVSTAVVAGALSLLTSVAGIPEVEENE